jgi:hypothetical protein
LKKGVTKSLNHKRYGPIGFWGNKHSPSFAFTRWPFVLKYVHKKNIPWIVYISSMFYTRSKYYQIEVVVLFIYLRKSVCVEISRENFKFYSKSKYIAGFYTARDWVRVPKLWWWQHKPHMARKSCTSSCTKFRSLVLIGPILNDLQCSKMLEFTKKCMVSGQSGHFLFGYVRFVLSSSQFRNSYPVPHGMKSGNGWSTFWRVGVICIMTIFNK